jgi:hypothetical protein
MHFKHSYMHNHAFYMLIHSLILLYHACMLRLQSQFSIQLSFHFQFSSISTFNSTQFQFPTQSQFQFNPISISNSIQSQLPIQFNFNSQFSVYVCISDYFQLSMSPSMSTFNSIQVNVNSLPICFWANNNGHVYFQIKSMSTYSQFVSFQIKIPIYILLYVLLSVKWLVRSKEQLVPTYIPMFPVKRQVRSEEQFVPCLCFVISQMASSIRRTVSTNLHVVILIKPQV